MTMAVGEDRATEEVVWGNVHVAFVSKDMVIILTVQETRIERGGYILQGCLQVLEDEGVRFQQVDNMLVELGVNQIDKEGVGEEDS